ncbi:hypothetical protein Ac2012v2_005919 [Leucoagaricus gongylophorus]
MSNILFYEPFHNFDCLLEHALRPLSKNCTQYECNPIVSERVFRPKMDLHENSEKNLVSATFELPGVKKEDVQLEVRDGQLTISAETKSSVEHEESGYTLRERRFGKFSRSLRLPKGVNDDEIKAEMTDGVLSITFPQTSPEQAPKRISIA